MKISDIKSLADIDKYCEEQNRKCNHCLLSKRKAKLCGNIIKVITESTIHEYLMKYERKTKLGKLLS